VTTALGPRGTTVVQYRSSTDIPTDAGLCICHNAIYPLYFTIHTTDVAGSDVTVGTGQTYLPVFEDKPRPVQVSWVWPIIDRPHRLSGDTIFTDDELAASVDGGRLDRVLSVVRTAGSVVPMTLVIDPALIDDVVMGCVMQVGEQGVNIARNAVLGAGWPDSVPGTTVEDVQDYWNRRPCNLRHPTKPVGSKEYFDDVEERKYFVEPHIPAFADFEKWKRA